MAFNIKPIAGSENRIIIEPAPAETKTASGIIIPDSAQEKQQKGTVIAVGDDKEEKPVVKEGDYVLFGKFSGTELKWEGKNYLIMDEKEIFGIINQ
nr:co-chaperone GroES [uncultured Flavobacterium sp.]